MTEKTVVRRKPRKHNKIYGGILRFCIKIFLCAALIIFIIGKLAGNDFLNSVISTAFKNISDDETSYYNEKITDYEELADTGNYPDSLIELAKNNPETIDFVKHYSERTNIKKKIDISGDLTDGIPLFIQWDERWGYLEYGNDFMAVTGCGPTCLSMVCCGLTGNAKWNPYKVAKMAEEAGYYVEGSGSSWELMTGGAANIGLQAESVQFDETHIVETLRTGKPIICVVGAGDFTTQGHFIVLTGVDDDGKLIINDPNSRERSKMTWDIDRVMGQIRNLWAYSVK